MYLVGYLKPYETEEGKEEKKIVNPIQCQNGDEICLAVEQLCAAIDYDMNQYFGDETWDALRDTAYFDTNYVTLDLHGAVIMIDIIVGKETMLRGKFLVEG